MSYTKAYGVYLWGSFLILAGNTAAPVLLRGLVRVMHCWSDFLHLDRYVGVHDRCPTDRHTNIIE